MPYHGAMIYSVGHSNRSAGALIELLRTAGVRQVVDIRARPHSTRHPQFQRAPLQAALAGADIRYHWAGRALGGLRPAVPGSPHRALPAGLQGYAAHMESEAFHRAVAVLRDLTAQGPLALLCAERLPEDCHRRLLCDYLLQVAGLPVTHLIDPGRHRPHRLSPEARPVAGGLVYDRLVSGELPF